MWDWKMCLFIICSYHIIFNQENSEEWRFIYQSKEKCTILLATIDTHLCNFPRLIYNVTNYRKTFLDKSFEENFSKTYFLFWQQMLIAFAS